MNLSEYKAAALGIIVYNHIAEGGKMPAADENGMELDIDSIDSECFIKALSMVRQLQMEKMSMNIVDCPVMEESAYACCHA